MCKKKRIRANMMTNWTQWEDKNYSGTQKDEENKRKKKQTTDGQIETNKIKVTVHLFLTTTNLDVKDWKLLIKRWILRTYRKQDLTLFCLQETHEMDTKIKTK